MREVPNSDDEESSQGRTCDWGRMMNNIQEYLICGIMPEVCQTKNSRKAIKRAAKEYILIDEKLYKKIRQKSSGGVTGTYLNLFWAYTSSRINF